jgi:streptogramin lyase
VLLLGLGLAALLHRGTAAASCGPTYGADGIAVDRGGRVWFTHYEDTRIARLAPGDGGFHEYLASRDANAFAATQAGRIAGGSFDYSLDTGFTGIALDERRGALWTARFNGNRLVRFSLRDHGFAEIELPARIVHARGPLPMAPDGSLWLLVAAPAQSGTGSENARLIRVTSEGKLAQQLPLPADTGGGASLALDSQGRPWLALMSARGGRASIFRLDGRRLRRHPTPDLGSVIAGMAFDRQDRLWLAVPDKNAIVRLTADKIDSFLLPTPKAFPNAVFVSPQGEVWFTEWDGGRLGRILRDGAIREYPLPREEEMPVTLAFDGDGGVWFSTLFNYALFRLDPRSGNIRQFAVPPPANWFEAAAATSSYCVVPARDTAAAPPEAQPLQAARHPRGLGEDAAAAIFERNCNTQCHSWYRVERAAERRTDWGATVDRMIEINGARFIEPGERKAIIRYLDANYAAHKRETRAAPDATPE